MSALVINSSGAWQTLNLAANLDNTMSADILAHTIANPSEATVPLVSIYMVTDIFINVCCIDKVKGVGGALHRRHCYWHWIST